MKWNPGDKKDRCDNWYTVPAPARDKIKAAQVWCKEQESTAYFYNHTHSNTRWWFQNKEDATIFWLTWSK